jgi:hypothetical protein
VLLQYGTAHGWHANAAAASIVYTIACHHVPSLLADMQQAACSMQHGMHLAPSAGSHAQSVGCDVAASVRPHQRLTHGYTRAHWQLPAAAPGYEETIAFDDDFPVHYERRPIVPRGMALHREPPLHDDVRAEVGNHTQRNRQSTDVHATGMKSAALNVQRATGPTRMGSARNVQC